jgi:hypothetical protein
VADHMSLDFFGLQHGGAIVTENHVLTEDELEERSIAMISELLKTQPGHDLRYKPENHGSNIWQLVFPIFGNVTVEEAVAQFQGDTKTKGRNGVSVSAKEAKVALKRTVELMNEQFKLEENKPAVVIEGRNGQSVLKKQY